MDAVLEHDLVEIDQQTQRFIQEFHVAEQLRLVDWKDLLDSLKLNNQTIVNQDIQTEWLLKKEAFVFDRNDQFILCRYTSQLAFPTYAFVIDGLQQPRPLKTMHFNCSANKDPAPRVSPRSSRIHRPNFQEINIPKNIVLISPGIFQKRGR